MPKGPLGERALWYRQTFALAMHENDGLTYAQIAEVLFGVPKPTPGMIERVKLKLRDARARKAETCPGGSWPDDGADLDD